MHCKSAFIFMPCSLYHIHAIVDTFHVPRIFMLHRYVYRNSHNRTPGKSCSSCTDSYTNNKSMRFSLITTVQSLDNSIVKTCEPLNGPQAGFQPRDRTAELTKHEMCILWTNEKSRAQRRYFYLQTCVLLLGAFSKYNQARKK